MSRGPAATRHFVASLPSRSSPVSKRRFRDLPDASDPARIAPCGHVAPPPSLPSSIPRFAGTLIGPDDEGYDAARRVHNGMVDRRPALIAVCESVPDVAAALAYARSEGMEVAVRAGGHAAPGFGTTDGGLLIDLRRLKAVHVDAARRIAWVQPGVLWGELDAATQEHGLAVTGGRVVVDRRRRVHARLRQRLARAQDGPGGRQPARRARADRRRPDRDRVADREQRPLLGLRGGGGNFGIVVEFEFALRPVGPLVLGGMMVWPRERAREVMRDVPRRDDRRAGRAVRRPGADERPAAPDDPARVAGAARGRRARGLRGCAGPRRRAHRAAARTRPAVDAVQPMPYAAVQTMLDPPEGVEPRARTTASASSTC